MIKLKDLLNIMDEDANIIIKSDLKTVFTGYAEMAAYSLWANDTVINIVLENDTAVVWVKNR